MEGGAYHSPQPLGGAVLTVLVKWLVVQPLVWCTNPQGLWLLTFLDPLRLYLGFFVSGEITKLEPVNLLGAFSNFNCWMLNRKDGAKTSRWD